MTIQGGDFYASLDGELNSRIAVRWNAVISDELIQKFANYNSCLIMGYGDGLLMEYFRNRFKKIILLEGDEKLAEIARRKYSADIHISCCHTFFEMYDLPEVDRIDVILGNHVLEHVDDPVTIMKKSRNWLREGGRAIFTVPNALSLHRKIGVRMKMLSTVYDLNEQDKTVGHARVYDQKMLSQDVTTAGYRIVDIGGFNLKILSQGQMKEWPDELLSALYSVSKECPTDICSNIYVVCA